MGEKGNSDALGSYEKQQIAIHILNNFLFVSLLHEIIKDKPDPKAYFETFKEDFLAKVTRTAGEFGCEDEVLKHARAVFSPLEKFLDGSDDLEMWDDLIDERE